MATNMANTATPKAMADWAKKALVFFAVGVWDSMTQLSPPGAAMPSAQILSSS